MNYKLSAHFGRTMRDGGGVCIYTKKSLLCIERKEITDLSIESHVEICGIECIRMGMIVVCLYRPPSGDLTLFFTKLIQLLHILNSISLKIVIVGDMNINLLVKSKDTNELNDILISAGLKSIVKFPTRITKTTQTCLDHAYTNIPKRDCVSVKSIDFNISDHNGVLLSIKLPDSNLPNPTIFKRLFSELNINNFMNSLSLHDWNNTLSKFLCPNEVLNAIVTVIKHFYDIHFPIKQYPICKKHKAWINGRTLELSNTIKQTKLLLSDKHSQELELKLSSLESKYSLELKLARKQFINDTISRSDNICRGVWRAVASETCRDNRCDALDVLISRSGGDCDCQRSANTALELNRFYINANKSINLSPCIDRAMEYLTAFIPIRNAEFHCQLFNISDVIKTVKNIKRKDSKDINDMSTRVLDYLPPFLFDIFRDFFNRCLQCGRFPSALKNVKVRPVYKGKGDMNTYKNYRPISIIPILAKLLEKLMSDRLMQFFNSNNLLNPKQYAYQSGRSTVDATREVVTRILLNLELRKHTAAVFCDLSRAFEMVDHSLLLAKLKHYGINGPFLEMITCFLRNRSQVTSVRDTKSDTLSLADKAVPQGSIMGNNLFLILINDLTVASPDADYVMFADDGCLIVSAENLSDLNIKMNKVVNEVSDWFSSNGMALNVEKTNIVHFRLRTNKNDNNNTLNVKCNGIPVPQVSNVKYLGFVLDEKLTWEPHIDFNCSRLSSACFALSRLGGCLNLANARKAYYGYFHSLLSYGVDLWGLAAERERPFRLQKRAVRTLCGVEWDHPARELFKKTNILTLPCELILQVAKYIRTNLEQFPERADSCTHSRQTRGRHQLQLPHKRLSKSQKQMGFFGVKVYNKLPQSIQSANTTGSFISKLKRLLLGRAYYTVQEFFDDKFSAADDIDPALTI